MKRLLSMLALCFCLGLPVAADTISFDSSFNTFSNAPQNIGVNFNLFGSIPVGSTINSLTVTLLPSASLVSSASVTNNDAQAGTLATFVLDGFGFTLSVPDIALQSFSGTNRNESQNVGPSGTAVFSPVTDLFSGVLATLFAGDCFDGVCTYTIDKNGSTLAETNNGNFTATVTTQVSGILRFTYDYTPFEDPGNEVPEPSTVILVGSALIALGVWGRKRVRG